MNGKVKQPAILEQTSQRRALVRWTEHDTAFDAGVEPLAVSLYGTKLANIQPGDPVLVLGGGTVALYAMYWARRLGAGRIVGMSRSPRRKDLSLEMGAFIAGVSLATVPIALVIAEELKPLRDFFLMLFFFSIGAEFDLVVSQQLILPGLVLTALLMIAKPQIFKWGFRQSL